ncbi:hypothetical protein IH824_05205 [candidate division KSB1 bacterium]|nr:hypothetical protein [candidate division KSB1 bacterium]
MKIRFVLFSVVLFLFSLIGCQKQEEIAKLSSEEVIKIITSYISSKIGDEGSFEVEDTSENRTRNLQFDFVHESVHETEDARYYACVDFTEGEVRLDLDLYVSKEDGEHKVSEVVIHKVNGESR